MNGLEKYLETADCKTVSAKRGFDGAIELSVMFGRDGYDYFRRGLGVSLTEDEAEVLKSQLDQAIKARRGHPL